MEKTLNGIIIKGIGGFYYVDAADAVFECKARGVFRKEEITPLPGDRVSITVRDSGENTVDSIGGRSSVLKRPPVANIDRLFIVASVCEPRPSTLVIDKLIAIAEDKGIEPVIVVTKTDIGSPDELADIYQKSGFRTLCVSSENGEGTAEAARELCGHISAFAGNSGVGKSSLLNSIMPELKLQTGEISLKLGRGRHTTRHVELIKVSGGYVADTPGFALIDTMGDELIPKENLPFCFREFLPFLGTCRFSSCAHVNDKGCKILEALSRGEICPSRHESYVEMYNEVKDIKDWQVKV